MLFEVIQEHQRQVLCGKCWSVLDTCVRVASCLLLQERSETKLKQFFEAYGPAEAAAMCYLLATSDKSMVGTQSCFTHLSSKISAPSLLRVACSQPAPRHRDLLQC